MTRTIAVYDTTSLTPPYTAYYGDLLKQLGMKTFMHANGGDKENWWKRGVAKDSAWKELVGFY